MTAKSDDAARLRSISDLCRAAEKADESEPERAVEALRAVLRESEAPFASSTFEAPEFAACGKIVNGLRKRHADAGVRAAAAAVKDAWTAMIIEQAKAKEKGAKGEEKKSGGDAGGAADAAKAGGEDDAAAKARAEVRAKLSKTDDAARDRTREIFADALSMCITDETAEGVTPAKLATIAEQIESSMSAKWPDAGKDYKAKVRQLAFNLKDAKNPDLRANLAKGEISAHVLIDLSPEELGSNERRQANEKIRELAEWEAVRGQQQEASTDAFKCGKCKQRKCTYYQLQTRSADEPMTTFVTWCVTKRRSRSLFECRVARGYLWNIGLTCFTVRFRSVNCGNRWKFC